MVGSIVKLTVLDADDAAIKHWRLDPGCNISRLVVMDNNVIQVPYTSYALPVGFANSDVVTVSGKLFNGYVTKVTVDGVYINQTGSDVETTSAGSSTPYSYINAMSPKPLDLLGEIARFARTKTNVHEGIEKSSGRWRLWITDETPDPDTYIDYYGTIRQVSYDITAGEGDAVNYTIQIDVGAKSKS
jgi:hypothetical protein